MYNMYYFFFIKIKCRYELAYVHKLGHLFETHLELNDTDSHK